MICQVIASVTIQTIQLKLLGGDTSVSGYRLALCIVTAYYSVNITL